MRISLIVASMYDDDMGTRTGSSGAMETKALELCFERLKKLGYNITYCSFDGDSETPKTLYSYFPYASALRDPSHQGKNSMKMLKRVNAVFKYNCECPHVISMKTGEKKRIRVANFYGIITTLPQSPSKVSKAVCPTY